ncbi:MAG: family 10 glycosylhydrolase, partial [Burkholderiaceae bacterium]|nr:family 10 glycosylhydrolase [Burkholderiaceae bacterium]
LASCSTPPETQATIPATTPKPSAPIQPSQVAGSLENKPDPLLQFSALEAPPAPREFRAAWVSTVANIDWPSRRDLSTEKQKAEIVAILDTAQQLKLNAIILQVRPSADAIYASELEPWSEFLTGTQGKAPEPFYDPLQVWIELAHARGMELHAWFNPFRARSALGKSIVSPKHVSKSLAHTVRTYGDLLWLDPAEPEATAHTSSVILDVVRRYAIDGVHIDDYFYPYPIKQANGQELDFPDDKPWTAYVQNGGSLVRADWRRDHVNKLVESLNRQIHQIKPQLKFGISPFGIGRPDRLPTGIAGFSQYDKLYADVELWLEKGWLDYLAPQLYWPIDQTPQAFKVLHAYWLSQNPMNRHIWPGLFTSKIDQSEKSWKVEEIQRQVEATREFAASGQIHFSMIALLQNRRNLRQKLAVEQYQTPALVPASPWLPSTTLPAPEIKRNPTEKAIDISVQNGVGGQANSGAKLLAIWKRYQQRWVFSVQSAADKQISVADDTELGSVEQITVSVVGQNGVESPRKNLKLK